jgi:hypothetical protein
MASLLNPTEGDVATRRSPVLDWDRGSTPLWHPVETKEMMKHAMMTMILMITDTL